MDCTVQNIKDGNIEGFKMAYYKYHSKLYFYVLKYTQSAYLSEETVQLTFIKLWEKREALSEDFNLSGQLFRMAKSVMIDLLRKQQVQVKHLDRLHKEAAGFQKEADFVKKEELYRVCQSIEQMPAERKAVFKLSRFQGLPHKEIAAQLSISRKAVENHIVRATKQLKNGLLIILFMTF